MTSGACPVVAPLMAIIVFAGRAAGHGSASPTFKYCDIDHVSAHIPGLLPLFLRTLHMGEGLELGVLKVWSHM